MSFRPHSCRQFCDDKSLVTLIATLFLALPSLGAQASDLPNFVLIVSDDQGWTGTSVSMHPDRPSAKSDYHQTPHLERLAAEGMRFTQGYASAPVCCPSRRSIQFGQTPLRQGDDADFERRYPPGNNRPTIPRLLKAVDARYAAAHFGKWDLRTDLTPAHLGYDESDGPTGNHEGNLDEENGERIDEKGSAAKWTRTAVVDDPKRTFSVTDRGRSFMARMNAADRPFFLQLSYYAVHAAFQARAETFAYWKEQDPGQRHDHPGYAAMTADLDAGLGLILDELERLGIEEQTYVIYTSDNGGVGWIPPDRALHLAPPSTIDTASMNAPLRAGKWVAYEGGLRVPFIIRGPGVRPGTSSNIPVVGWDLLPTIADLAGYRDALPNDIDGVSFRAVLTGEVSDELPRPTPGLYFNRYSDSYGHVAIRVGDDKLVRFQGFPCSDCTEPLGLFDLSRDPGERHNLAAERRDKVRELNAHLETYMKHVRESFAERN